MLPFLEDAERPRNHDLRNLMIAVAVVIFCAAFLIGSWYGRHEQIQAICELAVG